MDPFIQDLQKQCLTDAEDFVRSFREALTSFGSNPAESLKKIMKLIHSIKGNLQAVGFTHCSKLMHEIEDRLMTSKEKVDASSSLNSDGENQLFSSIEFALSDSLNEIESYFEDLKQDLQDDESKFNARSGFLTVFDSLLKAAPKASAEPAPAPEPVSEPQPEPSPEPEPEPQPEPKAEAPPAPAPAPEPETTAPQVTAKNEPDVKSEPVSESGNEPADDKVVPINKNKDFEIPNNTFFLICSNEDRNFAFPVQNVVEVRNSVKVNPLPVKKKSIVGLANLRGEVIPIVNLKDAIGESGKRIDGTSYVIIATIADRRFGFVIDDVHQVKELTGDMIQNAKETNWTEETPISGYYMSDEKMVMVLDLERVVNQ